MTREETLNMLEGPEANELVAIKFLGWQLDERKTHYIRKDEKGRTFFVIYGDFLPSKNIADAWYVFEMLHDKKAMLKNEPEPSIIEMWKEYQKWWIRELWLHHDGDIPIWTIEAETAPLAICRAALLAVMAE